MLVWVLLGAESIAFSCVPKDLETVSSAVLELSLSRLLTIEKDSSTVMWSQRPSVASIIACGSVRDVQER